MNRIEDLINFVKWQIKIRLPDGGIYERTFGTENIRPEDKIRYYLYLCDMYSNKIQKYIYGNYRVSQRQLDEFFNFLNDNYSNGQYYSFMLGDKVINLPIPEIRDRKVFRAELFDLIFPYLAGYPHEVIPFHEGPYELGNVRLNSNDTVIDAGANFGIFSAYASAMGCKVHAFEPTPSTCQKYLNFTSMINDNIMVHQKALSNITGFYPFLTDDKNIGCNGLKASKSNILYHDLNEQTAPTITIDEFKIENGIKKIDFIKADIEGAERLMLEGAKKTLKDDAPMLAVCYYHLLDDYKTLANLITSTNNGYQLQKRWKKIYAKASK